MDHPAFPQPDNPSISIWRFMDENKFVWLVENERLFMACASQLGDPLEGSLPTGEAAFWEEKISDARTEEARRVAIHNRDLIARFARRFRDNFYYVSCWHQCEFENYAMWSCYTNTENSVAIKTRYELLRAAMPDTILMGIIRYVDYATATMPTWNMYDYIMHKDIGYTFEQEIRLIATPPAYDDGSDFWKHTFELEHTTGFIVHAPKIEPKAIVREVVLHPKADARFERRMRDFCLSHELPLPTLSRKRREPLF